MTDAQAPAALPVIPVAAGCLVNDRGEVLIAQRPAGRIAAGMWEFPGGKIEPGETPRAALARELHEELGIEISEARPLIRIRHRYSDRVVILDTWRVTGWAGDLHGREAQAFAWTTPARLHDFALLAADRPIVSALRLAPDYVFTPPQAFELQILQQLPQLPAESLLRLRLPDVDDAAYARIAASLAPSCRARGLGLVLDRDPALVGELGAAGWHATSRRLAALEARPLLPDGALAIASCHHADELAQARVLGFDAAVLGPVRATPTHPGSAALGWARFAEWVQATNLPVFGIGGVGPGCHTQLFESYAQGSAGISAYWG